MKITEDIFFEHKTSISDGKWKIDLSYESSSGKSKKNESLKDIKQIQSEAIPALMQTCYNLENKDGEIIDHFFKKKSKKQLAKIKSILPQLF